MAINPSTADQRPVNEIVSRGLPGLANKEEAFIAMRLLAENQFSDDFGQNQERLETGTIQRLADWTMFGEPGQEAAINRRPGDDFAQSEGYGLNPLTFRARAFGKECKTPREHLRGVQLGTSAEFTAKEVTLAKTMRDLVIEVEKYTAPIFQTAGHFSSTLSPTTKWDAASSDPMADLIELADRIIKAGGFVSDLVLPRATAKALRTNGSLRDYTNSNLDTYSLSKERLAAIFKDNIEGLQRVWFPYGQKRTNKNPKATLVLEDIWNDTVFLGGLADMAGIPVGDGSRNEIILHPTAVARVEVEPWNVESYESKPKRSFIDQIYYRQWTGVVNAGAGGTITTPLTP